MLAPLGGCIGVFAEDGSSLSVGSHAGGALLRGVALPTDGDGYRIPQLWQRRGRQFGTEEVVRWLTAAFRDVDIFFYAIDLNGQPYLPERAMLHFAPDGSARAWSPPIRDQKIHDPIPVVRFDARRNWALVRALLSDATVEVQWIFINRALGERILREGPDATDDPALVARAASLFHQPSDAGAHDDHMHVRVHCAPSDRLSGCMDRGPRREPFARTDRLGPPLSSNF